MRKPPRKNKIGENMLLPLLHGGMLWADDIPSVDESWWNKERKALGINLAINGGVAAYGFGAWGWGSGSFKTSSEGWFRADTKYGGADKIGHAYTGYVFSELLADRYSAWGYSDNQATWLGFGSSVAVTSLIEVGDGLSTEYGFSWEDLCMNISGAAFSLVRRSFPSVAETIDFRIEYFPSKRVLNGDDYDIMSDYDGMKHLVAFKLAGLPPFRDNWARFFELHAGYYTRGFPDEEERNRRIFYGAIGINVGEVVAALWQRSSVFTYYQIPFTYAPYERKWSQ
jgi:uncharacterized protein YfiM (DUF2279 family)